MHGQNCFILKKLTNLRKYESKKKRVALRSFSAEKFVRLSKTENYEIPYNAKNSKHY